MHSSATFLNGSSNNNSTSSSSFTLPSSSSVPHSALRKPSEVANGDDDAAVNGNNGNQLSVILTVRILMQGKEVGSIIGKRGDYVRQIREQSGAKINISDGSCPERIVTISGSATAIDKAFTMVAKKFEEDMQALQCTTPKPPITLRLLIAASQCGSLIGKGGAKIREIRDKTGASLQVASEMLSNSTEKPVTISGSSEALIGCMREVCQILLDAPAKGPTIQYKPLNQAYNPLAVVSSAAAIAAAAAAQQQKGHQQNQRMAFGGTGGLPHQQAQLAAGLVSNPLLSLQEQLALLHNLHNPSNNHNPPFPVDPVVSRFLLQPNGALQQTALCAAGTIPVSSAAFGIPNMTGAGGILPNPAAFFINPLTTLPVTSNQHPKATELYSNSVANGGLDAATLSTLLSQQNGIVDAASVAQQQAQAVLQLQQQQQHIQLMYQQQQQQQQQEVGHEQSSEGLITGRTIGSNGQPVKEGGGTATIGSIHNQAQKRFTPY